MNRNDALRMLGLGRDASVDEARRAYREQVKLWHPDRYSDNSALKTLALRNAQDANRAWAYLRSRLPPSPPPRPDNPKAAATPPQERQRSQAGQKFHTAHEARRSEYRRRMRDWLTPLIERIKRIQIAGIASWLRDDPNRRYRPWYRYSQAARDHSAKPGTPTFSQTLKHVMRTRSSGSLTDTAHPYRKTPPARGVTRPKAREDASDRSQVGAVDPADRSRET